MFAHSNSQVRITLELDLRRVDNELFCAFNNSYLSLIISSVSTSIGKLNGYLLSKTFERRLHISSRFNSDVR